MGFQSLRTWQNADTEQGVQARTAGEIGRIRMGQRTGDRGRPTVAESWIVTCRTEEIGRVVADHFGAPLEPWDGQGRSADRWKILTGTRELPVRMAPGVNPDLMAEHELFGGQGMIRRCSTVDGRPVCWTPVDGPAGRTEIAGECVCRAALAAGTQPANGLCRPTLRLNVFLDVPAIPVIGVFSFVSHSEQACEEMPGMVRMLAQAEMRELFLPATLRMDDRQSQGGKNRFTVPVLDVRVSQSALMAPAQIESGAVPVAIGTGDTGPEPMVDEPVREGWLAELRALPGQARDHARVLLSVEGLVLTRPVPAARREDVERVMAEVRSFDGIEDAEVVEDDV